MQIKKCKWYMNAESPVMFMIDDFCNTWVDNNGNGCLDIGEDWGHWGEEKGSMWHILNEDIFSKFPHVKTTLFTVVGKREPIIKGNKKIYSKTILEDKKFLTFLRKIDLNPNIEIAYHGTTHGKVGQTRYDFKEEWQTYKSLKEALETIKLGKEIFYKALGKYPKGGKYCGYKFNGFSDESISKNEFIWWCRHWDAQMEQNPSNEELNYELEMFKNVVDIPSTIDGSYYSMKNFNKILTKKYIKSIIEKIKYNKTVEKLINDRVKNNQIISIQEHSSPYRADGRIQYPNIVSDMSNLKYIFSYLKKFNVWYATGSEIAEYYLCYSKTSINTICNKYFYIDTDDLLIGKNLTVKVVFDNIVTSNYIIIKSEKNEFILKKHLNEYVGNILLNKNNRYKIIIPKCN